jgi:hypothetical protein
MRIIQRLGYDGKRLFCPIHPRQQLIEGPSAKGYAMICFASVPGTAFGCGNSAEWESREAMESDLANTPTSTETPKNGNRLR